MNISEKANPKEIQTAYRKIALKYHPDMMPEEEGADEYFKTITKGYNILSNPIEKAKYDLLLSVILEKQKIKTQQEKKYGRKDTIKQEDIRNKIENIQKNKKLEAIRLFKRREKVLNHKMRYSIIVLLMLSGYFYVFNNWFVDEAGMDYFYIILGFFIFGLSTFFLFNHIYIQLRALNLIGKALKFPHEKISVTFFILVIICAPISIVGLNTFKKQYHLSHYSILVPPLNVSPSHDNITYSYYTSDGIIHKTTREYPTDKIIYYLTHKKAIVRVSKYNAKISRLEFIDLTPSALPKI